MKKYNCGIEAIQDVIGGKWKSLVLWHLKGGTKRTGELKKLIPGITQKMLAQQLKNLERQGFVRRTVYAQVPPKVEYSLTESGFELKPILEQMCEWGKDYMKKIGQE
ncbi:MAG: helix-turn-helix domain-containing protein [Nanoarchaeota archaeon]